jgi:GTP pyrophosphokinase
VKLFAARNVKTGRLNYVARTSADGSPTIQNNRNIHTESKSSEVGHGETTGKSALDYTVAPCCNPIPGDEVIGLVASDVAAMQIHRTKCLKAQELMTVHGCKMLRVNWANHESISYVAEIKVIGIDRQGLSNEISRIISNDLNLNIKSFHIDAENGLTEGAIAYFVKNTADLNDVIDNLNIVEGITHVTRVN